VLQDGLFLAADGVPDQGRRGADEVWLGETERGRSGADRERGLYSRAALLRPVAALRSAAAGDSLLLPRDGERHRQEAGGPAATAGEVHRAAGGAQAAG